MKKLKTKKEPKSGRLKHLGTKLVFARTPNRTEQDESNQ